MGFIIFIVLAFSTFGVYLYFLKKNKMENNSSEIKSTDSSNDKASKYEPTEISHTNTSITEHSPFHNLYHVINSSKIEEELQKKKKDMILR